MYKKKLNLYLEITMKELDYAWLVIKALINTR